MSDSDKIYPAYYQLFKNGVLQERVKKANAQMQNCDLCARYCHVNRFKTIEGAVCRTGAKAIVHSYGPHHGEENPLRGIRGSGTIFFSQCNLRCVYCQNWEISQKGFGREVTAEELARMMLELQERGCHNINFVSPSHVVAQILEALLIAVSKGLCLPLVYNSGGYDSPEALELLDGVIDIYMPDMKYGNSSIARKYSHVRNYWEINRAAVKEMYRQVGDLVTDENGVAMRGLLVRHLVLPGDIANTKKVVDFLAKDISTNTYLNMMDQYYPCYRAYENPPLERPLKRFEFEQAVDIAKKSGLNRLD